MNEVTLGELIEDVNSYLENYNTGNVSNESRIRHINRAIEWAKRKARLSADERIQNILFTQDNLFYDLDNDVSEGLLLKYKKGSLNTPKNSWEWRPYSYILQRTGRGTRENYWSITHINGKKQLIVWGYNDINQGTTIDSMDSIGDWEVQDDAEDLRVDNLVKEEGNGSLAFDIVKDNETASLNNSNVQLNFEKLFEEEGFVKLFVYLTDSNIDDVTLWLYTDASNYFTITVDQTDEGRDFTVNEFIKLGFHTKDRTVVGNPDPANITRLRIEFSLGTDFVSATDFRVDHIFTAFPDELEFIYLSSVKGTDSSDGSEKTILDDSSDIVLLGDDDMRDIIARRAALTLYPNLRGIPEWYAAYQSEVIASLRDFARRNPRQRAQGQFTHRLSR